MLGLYYGAGALVGAIVICIGLWLNFKLPAKMNIFFKATSLTLLTVWLVRYLTGSDNISAVRALAPSCGFSSTGLVALGLIQVWFAYAVELLITLASFFKLKTLPALVAFFGTAVTVLDFALLGNYTLAIVGSQGVQQFDYRALLMSVELGLMLGYCVVTVVNKRSEIILHGKDWVWFAFAILGMIVAIMPSYAPEVIFDAADFQFHPLDLNLYHRLILYPIAIIPIGLYLILRNTSLDTRKFVMMYFSWAGLFTFVFLRKIADYMGSNGGWVTSLPLHLCNTAMFVTPFCLTFNRKRLFYFTYFINVMGAFFALTMPNYSESTTVIATSLWDFYINHYQAFFMPLLLVGLGVFRRPRWKEFKYSMMFFAIYFVAMLILNAWFTNYNPNVDYFFLNSNFIADKFGNWGNNLRLNVLEFDIGSLHFKLYPLYQFLFFLVYFAIAFGIWYVYEIAYDAISGWQDIALRNKKVKMDALALQVALGGRSTKEPVNMQGENKLVLKNFTKRYGKSDVYAVKDANLEVCGGEIFGFLGPNGAGKSTIIKSIVGIQTITDGAIEVCGYDVSKQSVEAKRQIGYVPDHYALYERLTAREYINYIADLYEVSKEDREERLNRFIELFEFQSAIDNPIKTYSHGMKQKVTIMSALIHNPKIWILDEPLTGLDPNSIFQVKECMKEHAAKGNVVFFSSHIIDVVERICDKIAIIRKGQIQCVEDVAELESKGIVLEDYYMQVINGKEVAPIAVNDKVEG